MPTPYKLTTYRWTINMRLLHPFVLSLAILVSGCAPALKTSTPPLVPQGTLSKVSVSPNMPDKKYLPMQAGIVEGTHYIFMQTGGGSIFLGPIFGSMNISRLSREMAHQYKDSIIQIDPLPMATNALEAAGIKSSGDTAAFDLKTFVFAQHGDDQKFRLALVFHIDNAETQWVGRYTYHLSTMYADAELGKLSEAQIAQYKAELANGALVLADLVKRDLNGELPATGKRVNFGSLNLIANKMGGLGIYTMPEELFFRDSQLLEETDEYVTVRVPGWMDSNALGGAIAYGVQRMAKSQVHTMKAY
jgi:hypothetical protein